MVRPQQAEKLRQREAIRDRVKFLLDYHWSGNQRQMARDLGVSQGLISKIVNGLQGAGRQFLTVLGQQRGVNPDWLLRGEGQPLSLPPKERCRSPKPSCPDRPWNALSSLLGSGIQSLRRSSGRHDTGWSCSPVRRSSATSPSASCRKTFFSWNRTRHGRADLT